jgi:hypothetical protein
LISPAGFLLALVFFLLPFAAISCEVPEVGSVEASYTGVDLITNGDPSTTTTGEFNSDASSAKKDDSVPKTDVQVLAIITAVLLAAGAVATAVPGIRARIRGWLGIGGAAVLGAVLLIVTEVVANANLKSALVDAANKSAGQAADPNFNFRMTDSVASSMVNTRVGFWLSVLALVAVLGSAAGFEIRDRMRRAQAVAQPAPEPPPDLFGSPEESEPAQ